MGLLVSTLAVSLKNTGVVYAFIPWLATALVLLGKQAKTATALLLFLGVVGAGLLVFGFDIKLAGVRTAWLPDTGRLIFAGYNQVITQYPLASVAINEWHSLVLNQSFSLAALLLILGIISLRSSDRDARHDTGVQLVVLAAIGTLLALIVSQIFLPQGFHFAVPGNDTGNSRFSIPFTMLVIPGALLALSNSLKPCRHNVLTHS